MRVRLEISACTIARIVVALVLVWAALKLWPEFVYILVSVLLAVSLYPAVAWLQGKGLPRALSITIAPRIYGKQLRLSTLAVLLALVVGGTLQGVLGAVLVLPIVAAYPIIERIWLADTLPPRVLHQHSAMASALESGSEAAVDAVLKDPRPQPR